MIRNSSWVGMSLMHAHRTAWACLCNECILNLPHTDDCPCDTAWQNTRTLPGRTPEHCPAERQNTARQNTRTLPGRTLEHCHAGHQHTAWQNIRTLPGRTPEHCLAVLQDCLAYQDVSRQIWPEDVELQEKLWGSAAALRKTADFLRPQD